MICEARRELDEPRPFSESGGEITPTMKVKRAVVAEKYADDIAGIYAGRKQPA